MKKFLSKYTTKQILVFLLIVFVSAALFGASFTIYFIKNTQKLEQYVQNYYILDAKYLELRNDYQQFINDIDQKSQSNINLEEQILEIEEFLQKIKANPNTQKTSVYNEVDKMIRDFRNYKENYEKIVETSKEKLEFETEYLKNNNDIYEDFDIEQQNYIKYFTRLQKVETKLFEGEIEFENFEKQYDTIVGEISQRDSSNVYSLFVKSKALNYLSEYNNIVIGKYARQKSIGITNDEGLKLKMNDSFKLFSSNNSDIIYILQDKRKKQVNRYLIIWILLTLSVLSVLSAASLYLINLIYKPIISINQNLKQLSQGKLSKLEVEPNSKTMKVINSSFEKIVTELNKKNDYIIDIRNRKENDYKPASNDDKIGKNLTELQDELAKRELASKKLQIAEDRQKFITNGLTVIGKVMRQNTNNLNVLVDKSLKAILDYLDVPQGAFYIFKNTERKGYFLELMASYAYGKEKNKDRIVRMSEGLLGTVAVEKKHMILNQLPENYIHVAIGYGSIVPTSLMIFPLLIDNTLYGVIEIAGLRPFTDSDEEFLLRLADEIAITVSYVQVNQQTAELLDKSNKQAEDFKMEKQLLTFHKAELENNLAQAIKAQKETEERLAQKENYIKDKVQENNQLSSEVETKRKSLNELNAKLRSQRKEIKELQKEIETLKEHIKEIRK